jgi:hypothetical protein
MFMGSRLHLSLGFSLISDFLFVSSPRLISLISLDLSLLSTLSLLLKLKEETKNKKKKEKIKEKKRKPGVL